jgi:DNA mismatch repair protein MutS
VHLSAVEHKDKIVFLHAVQAGPASQSYGLQVAQLAGVPQPVIRAARKHLASLEAQSLQSTPQFDLFAAGSMSTNTLADDVQTVQSSAVDEAVADINPDALTPREALDLLYRLKELSNQQRSE